MEKWYFYMVACLIRCNQWVSLFWCVFYVLFGYIFILYDLVLICIRFLYNFIDPILHVLMLMLWCMFIFSLFVILTMQLISDSLVMNISLKRWDFYSFWTIWFLVVCVYHVASTSCWRDQNQKREGQFRKSLVNILGTELAIASIALAVVG